MNKEQLETIQQKITDFKVFLEFGSRTAPLVDEIAAFVEKVGPMVEGIRSLVDVASVKLPKASQQLQKVNEAAEKASTDILNTVDNMAAVVEQLQSVDIGQPVLESVCRTGDGVDAAIHRLTELHKEEEAFKHLRNVWDMHYQSLKALRPGADLAKHLSQLQEHSTAIMLAMQVQDITGQQVATVIGLMQAMDDVLRRLLVNMMEHEQAQEELQPAVVESSPEIGASDRQRLVDALLHQARQNKSN